jgi:DNA-binding NarL/FixJ family response regulator
LQKLRTDAVKLSTRELEVLKLICDGFSNAEIAEQLFISHRTVDRHRANLLSKTGCKNSTSLVMYAVKNKIVEID